MRPGFFVFPGGFHKPCAMPRALKVCSTPRCPTLTALGRCDECKTKAEQQRGTARQRGYGYRHETRFRPGVLTKDPLCVCVDAGHGHGGQQCLAPSTVADHYPHERVELIEMGLDPDDPVHGRGLCSSCHNKKTSATRPGGWLN